MKGLTPGEIYEGVMGRYIPENQPKGIENLFEDGKLCMNLYGEALDAYWRICERIGEDEDEDADCEIIFDAFLNIVREVGMKMYEYGAKYGK